MKLILHDLMKKVAFNSGALEKTNCLTSLSSQQRDAYNMLDDSSEAAKTLLVFSPLSLAFQCKCFNYKWINCGLWSQYFRKWNGKQCHQKEFLLVTYENSIVFSWQGANTVEIKSIFIIVARKNDTTIINLNVHEGYLLCKCLLNKDGNKPPKKWSSSESCCFIQVITGHFCGIYFIVYLFRENKKAKDFESLIFCRNLDEYSDKGSINTCAAGRVSEQIFCELQLSELSKS